MNTEGSFVVLGALTDDFFFCEKGNKKELQAFLSLSQLLHTRWATAVQQFTEKSLLKGCDQKTIQKSTWFVW